MERIQRACVRLIDHYDSSVRKVIEEIAAADREREQDVVRLKAKLHTAEIQIKTLNAAIKRKDAQIKELQRMQFGQSAEKGFSSPGHQFTHINCCFLRIFFSGKISVPHPVPQRKNQHIVPGATSSFAAA